MKYDKAVTDKLRSEYLAAPTPATVAALAAEFDVPERSVIAKLASMGIYQRKEYLNKRGEKPIKKEEYIERIANLLSVNVELLESLEKVNKNVLKLLETALSPEIEENPENSDLGA